MPPRILPATPGAIAEGAALLRAGRLLIVPTDTVYGVAADVRADAAVEAIYAAKGKGPAAPLQLLFGQDPALVAQYAVVEGAAAALIHALGPGGWTVICRAREGWQSPALAGGETVGVRMPASATIAALVAATGAPLAASSANRHGSPSPRTCTAAAAGLGDSVALALDNGEVGGIDSTVIDAVSVPPRILREGAIDRATVARILDLQAIEVLRSVRTP